MTARQRGKTLGVRARARLNEAYEARGNGHSNLWLHYSPKADKDVVLASDIEFGHFLLVESDPDIEKVDYAPHKRVAAIAGEGIGTIVDAEVKKRDGQHQWREVKSSESLVQGKDARASLQILVQQKAAGLAGVEHVVFTEKVIYANPIRIRNWFNLIPWIAQVRYIPIRAQGNEVAAFINAKRRVSFREVLELGAYEDRGLYAAALLKGVQSGAFQSDLNERPFCAQSSFFLHEATT